VAGVRVADHSEDGIMGASMVVAAKALTVGGHPPILAIIREGAWRRPQRPVVRLAAYCWPGGRPAERA